MSNIDQYGRPLLQAIADWEREHGTICVMMPEEREGFIAGLQRAAIFGSARAAVETDPLTLYTDSCGFTFVDFPDHVLMEDGRKQVVLVSTIFDDGEDVGPENPTAVCANIEKAHAFVIDRFAGPLNTVRRSDDSPLSSYRCFVDGKDMNTTIWLTLIDLVD